MTYHWILPFLFISTFVQANCQMYFKDKPLDKKLKDPLYKLVTASEICVQSIQELRRELKVHGLKERIAMVANRGRNNPNLGSFSFFESVYGQKTSSLEIRHGELFLGYFTGLDHSRLFLDQYPEDSKLLIEAISWDNEKELYNFYELRGIDQGGTRWFYRGDSKDAYKDNQWLYRDSPKGKDHFGKRMRCSACHNSGGPILKELTSPHNDWWTKNRPLILQPNDPDFDVEELVEQLVNANTFAEEVKQGMQNIQSSNRLDNFHKTLSLQEQLRPLFCTTEINIASSMDDDLSHVSIPSGFWLNPLLGHFEKKIPSNQYEQLLTEMNMQFPENGLRDADHRWLTPVKGVADLQAIEKLIQDKIITKEFALAVLMVDFTHPVFSEKRCALLKLVPNTREQWMFKFNQNLSRYGAKTQDLDLLLNVLILGKLDYRLMSNKIKFYEQLINQFLSSKMGVKQQMMRLVELRMAVKTNELSKNPLGQILEPGFRVIFPEISD
ncbi:hypothetical protein [Legionella waltersii]|uniref:Rod shape-determining protein MreB n=1 Tax=Legionella waltersii TaxID=66969 RepID=A0A0W1A003_9GAMM|nr:hypothetical protein [Legionella waltersii]KTD74664.1 rod shape-determining protein MreB [Legionella waltersii]SNV09110.1 rod shape-determining protein MreB [Legionella waltersii]